MAYTSIIHGLFPHTLTIHKYNTLSYSYLGLRLQECNVVAECYSITLNKIIHDINSTKHNFR